MGLPWSDSLETVESIHLFLEIFAILLFVGVVLCDVILKLMRKWENSEWTISWGRKPLVCIVHGRPWVFLVPAFSSRVSPFRVLEVLSLVLFALAIFVELAAYPYSRELNRLTDQQSIESQKQISASLERSQLANDRAAKNELARITLELQIAPRRLNVMNQLAIAVHCRSFKESLKGKRVKLVSYWLDAEAGILAEQIVMALRMKPCGMVIDDDAIRSIEQFELRYRCLWPGY